VEHGCSSRRRRTAALTALLAVVGLVVILVPSSAFGNGSIAKPQAAKANTSVNAGAVAPTAVQRSLVEKLGAHATWNRYGTPASLIRYEGYLATGLSGSPVDEAKAFLGAQKALFKLSSADSLALVNDVKLTGTQAHAVLFAQKFGALQADWNGLIAVGVIGDKVAYVSSINAASQALAASPKLSATDAWTAAAHSVGISGGSVGAVSTGKDGWTSFDVSGLTPSISSKPVTAKSTQAHDTLPPLPPLPPLPTATGGSGSGTGGVTGTTDPNTALAQIQQAIANLLSGLTAPAAGVKAAPYAVSIHQGAKLIAFPTLQQGVRPAWLVNVVDLRPTTPRAYQIMVDASNGAILMRHNAVQNLSNDTAQPAYTFTGDYGPPPACGPMHAFAVDSGEKAVAAAASALNPTNDIILKLFDPSGTLVGSSDTATSPEAVLFQDPNGNDLATGNWLPPGLPVHRCEPAAASAEPDAAVHVRRGCGRHLRLRGAAGPAPAPDAHGGHQQPALGVLPQLPEHGLLGDEAERGVGAGRTRTTGSDSRRLVRRRSRARTRRSAGTSSRA
jgi:hypothetical protein